jgi:GNAT superfamily N-acetyltransferase
MIIRKAILEDSEDIATYLLLAMEDVVFKLIGENNYKKGYDFLLHFIQRRDNQYSYQNCLVAEDQNEVIAAINLYDGARFRELRQPIIEYLKTEFDQNLALEEEETQSGEYYIDSFGVNLNQQGKGIGSKILQFLINEYVNENHQTLGLLVDEENPSAKKLYLKLGFKSIGKKTLAGKNMIHLQMKE